MKRLASGTASMSSPARMRAERARCTPSSAPCSSASNGDAGARPGRTPTLAINPGRVVPTAVAPELERDQSTYSIYRTFEKSSPVCRLADETRSRELEPSAENFSELLCGLTPALFGNTISVSQLKAETNADLADSLRNHIVNLHTTGSATLNVTRAIDSLRADKKKLEAGIVRDADQETEVLTEQLASLEQVLKDSSAEQEIARLEKKKGILEETIQFLGTRQQRMAHQQKRGENALTHYHFSHPAEADEVYAQTEELEAQADQYLSRYHRPLGLILRFALLLFSLLLAILPAVLRIPRHPADQQRAVPDSRPVLRRIPAVRRRHLLRHAPFLRRCFLSCPDAGAEGDLGRSFR